MAVLDEIKAGTISGDMEGTLAGINRALENSITPAEIIQNGLIAAMTVVGEKFKIGDIYVPEMLIAARAMKAGLEILKPLMVDEEIDILATVVLGTVKGDLHDIGKNLVAIMMEGAGCKIIDLGVDVAPETFVEAAKEHNPQFIALSALLTTTLPAMQETIKALEKAGIRNEAKVLVGGAPLSQKFADEIGADGYAEHAAEAADKIRAML